MSIVIGYEVANSFVKIRSRRGEDIYPNTLRRIEPFEMDLDLQSGRPRYTYYTIGKDTYVAGERSLKTDISSSSRDSDRYDTPEFFAESLIAISQHAEHEDELVIVTGLPVNHFQDGKSKEKLLRLLGGEHRIYVNGRIKTFYIRKVLVILQPIGTLTSLIFDLDGFIVNQKLVKTTKVIIDIGWGTTDVAILDGLRLIRQEPVDMAMLDAYLNIERAMRHEFDYIKDRNIPLFKLEEQLRDSDSYIGWDQKFNVKAIKARAFEITASTIMSQIKNKVTLSDYDQIIFTGGGVSALKIYLKAQLEDKKNIYMPSNTQMANATGFYVYGKVKENEQE